MTREMLAFVLSVLILAIVAYAALRGSSSFFWTVILTLLAIAALSWVAQLIQRG